MNDDTISRRAAIDRINKQREHLRPDIYEQDYIGDAAYRICAEFIERLPSAQPKIEERTEEFAQNVPKEDLISRKAAIDVALSAFSRGLLASPDIRRLPSVQPDIVRCKDCMHYSTYYRGNESKPVITNLCKLCLDRTMEPDDYCSRAERRTDE